MPHETLSSSLALLPGVLTPAFNDALQLFSERRFRDALRRRDPSVWSADAAVQKTIANRLGWLTAPDVMPAELDDVERFAAAVRGEGVRDVVLLGMAARASRPRCYAR